MTWNDVDRVMLRTVLIVIVLFGLYVGVHILIALGR